MAGSLTQFRAQHQNDSLRRESVNGSDLKKERGVEVRLVLHRSDDEGVKNGEERRG